MKAEDDTDYSGHVFMTLSDCSAVFSGNSFAAGQSIPGTTTCVIDIRNAWYFSLCCSDHFCVTVKICSAVCSGNGMTTK